MATTIGLTIEGAIRALFPRGYLDYPTYSARLKQRQPPEKADPFEHPPCKATDLFAIAGFLLLRSGAYHHVSPEVTGAGNARTIAVTPAERETWRNAGRIWRGDGKATLQKPPAALVKAWDEVMADRTRSIYRISSTMKAPRRWWRAALALLCIADEAARDLGFETGRPKSSQARTAELAMRRTIKAGHKNFTISSADTDQVCVLPKTRTPKVGCTLRSLSHNLALLPPRGLARAYWTPGPPSAAPSPAAPFNILIVPMPYQIRASAFRGIAADEGKWGWFDVEAHWCPPSGDCQLIDGGFEEFFGFVDQLIREAEADVREVHGLVFPEVALSHDVFDKLCHRLRERPRFELLIAGLFDARIDEAPLRPGNFAAMASFQARAEDSSFDLSIREKHHRWRLDSSQIENYALGSALDANWGWWERIDILSRSLDMFVLRGVATVTTLICEDLARNDPCQELVRVSGVSADETD